MTETGSEPWIAGPWTAADYLARVPRGYELVDGRLDALPVCTRSHQRLIQLLSRAVEAASGFEHVEIAGFRVRTVDGRYREPDVLYTADLAAWDSTEALTADLAIEVVSEGPANAERDRVTKRGEYAAAGFPEYWIVDPQARTVTVLLLDGDGYAEAGVFGDGDTAVSRVLPALRVEVGPLMDRAGA